MFYFKSTFINLLYKIFILFNGNYFLKLKGTLYLVATISPIAYIFKNINMWYFDNQKFILFVLGAIAFDHFIGSIYHAFWKNDFSWKKNVFGITIKILLTLIVGFCFEGINHIIKKHNLITDYLDLVGRLTIFLWPAGSLFVNCSKITNGVFPPLGIIKWLKNFNKNLELPKKE